MTDALIALLPLALLLGVWVWLGIRFRRGLGTEAASPVACLSPYGVHGVLAFFVFVAYYVAPLFIFGATASSLMDAERQNPGLATLDGWETYKTLSYLVTVGFITLQIWVAYGLKNNLKASSLSRARLMCFAVPLLAMVVDSLLVSVTLNVSLNGLMDADSATVSAYLKAIITGWIWGLYFVLSRRCRNTYLFEPQTATGGYALASPTTPQGPDEPVGESARRLGQDTQRPESQRETRTPIGRMLTSLSSSNNIVPMTTNSHLDRSADSAEASISESDESLWATAAAELAGPARKPGLWAKAFAEAGANEALARASYLKWRVAQLHHDQAIRLRQAEQSRRAEQEEKRRAEFTERARLYGECPCCGGEVSWMVSTCPHCKASFGHGSSFRLQPLRPRG